MSKKPNLRYSKTADLLCEMGRFGQKVGKRLVRLSSRQA